MHPLVGAAVILSTLSFFVASAQESAYKYEVNKTYSYLIESKSTEKQEANGREVITSSAMTAAFQLTILERTEDCGMKAKIEVQSAVLIIEGPSGIKTFGQDLNGKSFHYSIDKFGDVTDEDTSIQALGRHSREILNPMMNFLPYLLAEKMEEGESWTRMTEDTVGSTDAPLYVSRETDYSIDETAQVNGLSCLKIAYESEQNTSGKASQMNQDFSVLGEREISGFMYFAYEQGIVVRIEITGVDESVYTSTSNPTQQVSITENSTVTVKLISE